MESLETIQREIEALSAQIRLREEERQQWIDEAVRAGADLCALDRWCGF